MATDDNTPHAIIIYCPEGAAGALAGILQYGFAVPAESGHTVREFLEDECAIDSLYASRRITTIFLNGSPVDNRDRAVVSAGATLSLSGSMPGLMGIMMRSGSPYSAMRASITFREAAKPESRGGMVNMKLFNLVLHELGPLFLQRGVRVQAHLLAEFISGTAGIAEAIERITVDERTAAAADLPHILAGIGGGQVEIRVSITNNTSDNRRDVLP